MSRTPQHIVRAEWIAMYIFRVLIEPLARSSTLTVATHLAIVIISYRI